MSRYRAGSIGLVLFAIIAWLSMEPPENSHVRRLIIKLEQGDLSAAIQLGELGPQASPAIPALIQALQSRQPSPLGHASTVVPQDFRPDVAREALVSIGRDAIPALTRVLKHRDALTRVHAARALYSLEGKADVVLPIIVEAWQDENLLSVDEFIRVNAVVALGEIGTKEPSRVLPILLPALKHDNLVRSAANGLRLMASADTKASEALVALLQDKRDGVADEARRLLQWMPDAVPVLIDALHSQDPEVRANAAWALCGVQDEMAARAQAAIPALTNAMNDEDRHVRTCAEQALKWLKAAAK